MTKTIKLPAGTNYVRYDELAKLIANALWPETGPEDDRPYYGKASQADGNSAAASRSFCSAAVRPEL